MSFHFFLQAETANSEKERSLLVKISELQSRKANFCKSDITKSCIVKHNRNSYSKFTTPYHRLLVRMAPFMFCFGNHGLAAELTDALSLSN